MTDQVFPEAGTAMVRGVRPMTLTYKGLSITFDMPGWYPEGGDDGVHSGEDMKVSDRVLNRLKARAEGLLEPENVRRIRRKLGLTQKEAGRLIGGGPNAFQKYENGDVLVSHGIASALRLLDADPTGLAVLREAEQAGRAAR